MSSHFRARTEYATEPKEQKEPRNKKAAGHAKKVVEKNTEGAHEEGGEKRQDEIMDILAKMTDEDIERLKEKLHVIDDDALVEGGAKAVEEQKGEDVRDATGVVADDLISVYSKKSQLQRHETKSVRSDAKSVRSSKTVVTLQQQLREERDARKKLEKELEEVKRISSEMSSQLGLLQKKKK